VPGIELRAEQVRADRLRSGQHAEQLHKERPHQRADDGRRDKKSEGKQEVLYPDATRKAPEAKASSKLAPKLQKMMDLYQDNKEAEARATVPVIARSIAAEWERELPPTKTPRPKKKLQSFPPIPQAVPRGTKYQPSEKEWATWSALKFEIDQPTYYQYEVRAAKDGESACCRIRIVLRRGSESRVLSPSRTKGSVAAPAGYWLVTAIALDAAGNASQKALGLVVGRSSG